jgi:hypothetical protein
MKNGGIGRGCRPSSLKSLLETGRPLQHGPDAEVKVTGEGHSVF